MALSQNLTHTDSYGLKPTRPQAADVAFRLTKKKPSNKHTSVRKNMNKNIPACIVWMCFVHLPDDVSFYCLQEKPGWCSEAWHSNTSVSIAACNYQPFVLKGFPWVFLCSPSIQGTCKRQLQDSLGDVFDVHEIARTPARAAGLMKGSTASFPEIRHGAVPVFFCSGTTCGVSQIVPLSKKGEWPVNYVYS